MMKILHRYTGVVLKDLGDDVETLRGANLGDANLGGANLGGANLGGAYLGYAYLEGANLGGANLGGANLGDANLGGANLGGAYLEGANLGGANLEGANLGGANLGGANLGGANLEGANLEGANLGGAYLGGANLGDQWVVQGPCRSDGYWFFLQKSTKEPMVKAGCRYLSVEDARRHFRETRGGTPLGDETEAILDCMIAMARARGLMRAPSTGTGKKVHVIMSNDYPDAVFASEAAAERYVAEKKAEPDNRPRIYWRSYKFDLRE